MPSVDSSPSSLGGVEGGVTNSSKEEERSS